MNNGRNGNVARMYPRALRVSALSKQQLAWLRHSSTKAEWGLRRLSTRTYDAPPGFDPALVADHLEQVVRKAESERDLDRPLLFCAACCGWRYHAYELDELVQDESSSGIRRPTYFHLWGCEACGERRVYGASVCSMGGPVVNSDKREVC